LSFNAPRRQLRYSRFQGKERRLSMREVYSEVKVDVPVHNCEKSYGGDK